MLNIIQARDYTPYYPKFKELGIEEDVISVVESKEMNKVIGYGIYYFKDDTLIIADVNSNNDLYLYDGIVRAIMFIAMNSNINKVEFDVKDKQNLSKLGFVKDNQNNVKNITDFLSKCKNCEKS